MEQETTDQPEPLSASGTLYGGLKGSLSGTASLGPAPKPPWYKRLGGRFETIVIGFITNQLPPIDWSAVWDAAQKFLQGCFGRKRQPAGAGQV